jgi:hypothetical protein
MLVSKPSRLLRSVAWIGFVLLAGCAGRSPVPTQEVRITDRYMSCEDIRKEVAANYVAQSDLVREQAWAMEKNDIISGFSLVFPPGWFGLDLGVEEDYPNSPQNIEHAALATRNRHLIAMAQEKGGNCWPGRDHWVRS